METSLSVTLIAADVGEAIDFCCNYLGFEVHFDSADMQKQRWARLKSKDNPCFWIKIVLPTTAFESSLIGKQGGENSFIEFIVHNLDEEYDKLEKKGIKPVLHHYPWISLIELKDPYGNVILIEEYS